MTGGGLSGSGSAFLPPSISGFTSCGFAVEAKFATADLDADMVRVQTAPLPADAQSPPQVSRSNSAAGEAVSATCVPDA